MFTTSRRKFGMFLLLIGLLITGCTQVHAQPANQPEVIQVQIGNGFVRQVTVGEPSACTGGTELNLTQSGSDLLSSGYYFGKTSHTVAPSIREVDGVEQVYLFTIGQTGDYLVFWPNSEGGISATQLTENIPTPLLTIPAISRQGWKNTVSMNGARITMINGDTKLWLTGTGNFFCVELQTPVSANDSGNLHFFATNGRLPVGNEIEVFVDN